MHLKSYQNAQKYTKTFVTQNQQCAILNHSQTNRRLIKRMSMRKAEMVVHSSKQIDAKREMQNKSGKWSQQTKTVKQDPFSI